MESPRFQQIHDYYVANNAVVTGDVVLSTDVNLWFNVVIRGDLATITLQPRVNIQDGTIVHTDADAPLTLEEGVVVGHGVILHGSRVGKGTLVGMGAVLLSGSDIGEECLIAAGTLVTERKRIPPRSVVMGVPGKVVREITEEELQRTHAINHGYIEKARKYVQGEFPPPWTS